jgi:hypothetical protein
VQDAAGEEAQPSPWSVCKTSSTVPPEITFTNSVGSAFAETAANAMTPRSGESALAEHLDESHFTCALFSHSRLR